MTQEEINNWYKSLKTCFCFLELKTAWGTKYNINQEYKYKILSLEELKKRGDKFLENKPVVLEHPRGTDRFSIEDFNIYFIDKAKWRDKQINSILEDE